MAVNKTSTGEAIGRAVLSAILNLGGGGGMAGYVLGGIGGKAPSNSTVDDEYPSPMHRVDVNYIPGPPRLNAGLQKEVAEKAARMQTLEEHNDALTKYLRALPPNATPREKHLAIVKGAEEEEELLSYWDDKRPRKNYTPSSSAVRSVRITPDHRIQVQWGTSPKWYTYKQHPNAYEASLAAQRLLTSNSIGRSVMPGKGFFSLEENDDSMRPPKKVRI
jgi:hypothetical protein